MMQSILNIVKLIAFVLSISSAFANSHVLNNPARYAPGVVSIINDHTYLQTHDAPIYWKISPYYLSQPTDASCSVTSAAMLMNALHINQMQHANQKLFTINSILHSTNNGWKNDVKQGGNGVTLDQFGVFLRQAMNAHRFLPTKIEVIHATGAKDVATKFHQALLKGERMGRTFIVVNFDQKFISGTESIGHFAPIGAYDAKTKRVLVMDPDRELFEPYWVDESRLLSSMETEDTDAHKHRGFVVVMQ